MFRQGTDPRQDAGASACDFVVRAKVRIGNSGEHESSDRGMIMRWFERVMMSLAALFLFSLPALAQQKYAAPFPRDGVKKVLEDEQFAVWDVTYEKGVSTGMHQLPLDQVSVNITVDGLSAIKVTKPDGTWSVENEKNGSVRFESKGTIEAEEGASDRAAHVFVFQLKEFKPPIGRSHRAFRLSLKTGQERSSCLKPTESPFGTMCGYPAW